MQCLQPDTLSNECLKEESNPFIHYLYQIENNNLNYALSISLNDPYTNDFEASKHFFDNEELPF